eukprot:364272-Chlamydomonas_euryale.AAC.8
MSCCRVIIMRTPRIVPHVPNGRLYGRQQPADHRKAPTEHSWKLRPRLWQHCTQAVSMRRMLSRRDPEVNSDDIYKVLGCREYCSTFCDTLSCPRLVARSVRPPSGTGGQWCDKPNFHTMAPQLGRHLQVCTWRRSLVTFVTFYDTGQKSVCIVAKTLIHKEDV